MIALQEKQRRTGTYTSKSQRTKPKLEESEKAEVEKDDNQKATADPVEATEDQMMAMFGIGDFASTKN